MSLDAALSIATGGISNINADLALISQNVANVNTPGYALEVSTQSSVTAGGQGMGVRSLPAQLQIDQQLLSDVMMQNATVAGLQTTQTALGAIDSVQGTPGQGGDLGTLLGGLQTAFSTLQSDPSNQAQQSSVVSAAQTLATGINALSNAYATQRQSAQDGLVTEVGQLNGDLSTIGSLSAQIVSQQAAGQSTADLQNQRNAAMQSASQLVGITFLPQANGDMLAVVGGGLSVPLHGTTPPFAIAGTSLGPNSAYPATAPAITLGGVDVTQALSGGEIGANVTLRDSTMPTFQAELDEFSNSLASQFSAQGLSLFTDGAGNVPSGGGVPVQSSYVGFSGTIQVNPAVLAQPSLVRDGTQAVAGSATGASAFTPNPTGGPAGFSTLIDRVLTYALGSQVQAGVAQPAPATGGLGPLGTLTAPFTAPATLADFATDIVSSQSQASASVQSNFSNEQAVQTTLQGKLADSSSVSIDTEMSQMITLQNAYSANARIIGTAQAMWSDLLGAVPT
jgi:flagellar hook-associated protein 1 FlgK